MIDHCVAAFYAEQKDRLFRIYVTDALQAIAENTMVRFDPRSGLFMYGQKIPVRWMEMVEPPAKKKEEPKEDTRTCAEIVSDIWSRMRGETT